MIVVNVLAFGSVPPEIIVMFAALVGVLLATQTLGKGFWAFLTVAFGCIAVYVGLSLVASGWFAAIIVTIAYWTTRLAITFGLFGFLFLSTSVSSLIAALAAVRLPRVLIVPLAVMLRFIPTAMDELKAIISAMRLRGVVSGPSDMLLHPMRMAEYTVLPLLASIMRIADELSAAALLRGLGLPNRPTSIVQLRVRWTDVAILLAVAAIAALHVMLQIMGWTVLR
jgi:energy-coupling factor transport system permease protein